MSPFDYVKSFNTKDYIYDSENNKEYVPYIVNKAISNTSDGIFHANEMNRCHLLDKKLQYDYYFYALTKRKRWGPWHKREDNENLRAVQLYYKYSIEKARSALSILTDDQLAQIKEKLKQGGVETKDEYS